MAMLRLMAALTAQTGWHLQVATVDHRLRPEAAQEAAFVARHAAALGLAHHILIWSDHPKTGNLMQAGSQARYQLLADWARAADLADVVLAHTADDQAETFLMGLGRSAGLDGLSGMRPRWQQGGVSFHRPFLGESRAGLREYLTRLGSPWCDDPSNVDPRYLRVRNRQALADLAPLGLSVERIQHSIRHLAQVQQLLGRLVAQSFAAFGREEAGALILQAAEWHRLDPELQRRLLVLAIRWCTGARHAPRAEALARLLQALLAEKTVGLAGCRFRFAGGNLRITREPRAVMAPILVPDHTAVMTWDHRWTLEGALQPGQQVAALGDAGILCCPDWRQTGLKRDQLAVSPAVWQGDRLIAAPLARPEPAKWRVYTTPGFGMFMLSH